MNVEGHGIKRFKRCNLIVETEIVDEEYNEKCEIASGCEGLDLNFPGSSPASPARL